MSQPNESYTTFRYSETQPGYYGTEQPQSSFTNPPPPFPQWEPQGSRPMGYSPSPSPTVRTSKSAPNPRPSVNIMAFNQSSVSHREHEPGPSNNSFLTVPQGSRQRLSVDNSVNPLIQFWQGRDEPWSSQHLRTAYPSQHRDFATFDSAASEIETLAPRSDSGYATTIPPRSISHGTGSTEQDVPHEVTYRIGPLTTGTPVAASNTDVASIYSSRSGRSGRSGTRSTGTRREYRCAECNEVSRCRSDYKKHVNRHSKPNLCLFPNCRRGGQGFTTTNDLDRHKKSVHGIGKNINSYRCSGSEACRTKGKIWPRLDNFKQHIHRMHKDEDEQDLINRSRINNASEEPEPGEAASMSMAPMDTTLAGIGTERQFSTSSNELDDPMSGISLTSDQESNRWSSFDPSTRDFSVDVDQTSPMTSVPGSNLHGYDHEMANSMNSEATPETLHRQPSCQRLDALAQVATSQTVPETPTPQVPQLSSAPQTKADQQKEALLKFGKLIVNATKNTSGEDMEDLLQRIVSQSISSTPRAPQQQAASQQTTQGSCAAQNTSQTNQSKAATPSQPRRRRTSSLSLTDGKQCEQCSLIVRRACDMRKHVKRHTRPYGCTYPNCDKRFGAKSDWKRHENSQHFQLESYRCQLPATTSGSSTSMSSTQASGRADGDEINPENVCGELFTRPKHFESHLILEHSLTDRTAVEHHTKACRIGKNGQGQFWCGFCVRVVRLEKKRNAAWDERFDHIDRHFCKEGRGIEEWVCLEGGRRKGDVSREKRNENANVEHDAEGDKEGEGMEGDEGRALPCGYVAVSPLSDDSGSPIDGLNGSGRGVGDDSRKRGAQDEVPETESPPVQKRSMHGRHTSHHTSRREHEIKYCCSCESGPWATHTFPSCVECSHQWCAGCITCPLG